MKPGWRRCVRDVEAGVESPWCSGDTQLAVPRSSGGRREFCALARVKMSEVPENRTGRPTTTFSVPWSLAHPLAAPGPCERPAETRCVDPPRSASRLGVRRTRLSGRGVRSPVRGSVRHAAAATGASATQRRSLWLDQASARRALAVPPRGISDASATTATSCRCSPETPVRSRRLPSAVA
jgi:hypothetical protein